MLPLVPVHQLRLLRDRRRRHVDQVRPVRLRVPVLRALPPVLRQSLGAEPAQQRRRLGRAVEQGERGAGRLQVLRLGPGLVAQQVEQPLVVVRPRRPAALDGPGQLVPEADEAVDARDVRAEAVHGGDRVAGQEADGVLGGLAAGLVEVVGDVGGDVVEAGGLAAGGARELPGGDGGAEAEDGLGVALGPPVAEPGVVLGLEGGGVLAGDDDGGGAESVPEAVEAGPVGMARAGALQRVPAVGFDLLAGGHDVDSGCGLGGSRRDGATQVSGHIIVIPGRIVLRFRAGPGISRPGPFRSRPGRALSPLKADAPTFFIRAGPSGPLPPGGGGVRLRGCLAGPSRKTPSPNPPPPGGGDRRVRRALPEK